MAFKVSTVPPATRHRSSSSADNTVLMLELEISKALTSSKVSSMPGRSRVKPWKEPWKFVSDDSKTL